MIAVGRRASQTSEIWLVDCSLYSAAYDYHLGSAVAEGQTPVRLLARALRPREAAPPADLAYEPFFYRLSEPLLQKHNSWVQRAARLLKGAEHVGDLARLVLRAWREQPALVHFFWTTVPNLDRLAIKLIQKTCPVLITVHNSVPLHGRRPLFNDLGSYVSAYHQADLLIAHAENTRQAMLAWGLDANKIDLITHPPLRLIRADAPAPRDPERFRILLWGAIKPYKGVEDLVEAVMQARSTAPRIELRVVGKPFYDVADLVQRVSDQGQADHISFDLEFKSEEALDAEIRACDLIALPYHEIDASGSFAASLGYDKAFVMSDVGYFSLIEIAESVRSTAFTPPRDVEALSRNLVALAADADLYKANVAAFDTVNRSYTSWSAVGERLNGIYSRLLANHHSIGAAPTEEPAQAVTG
ncbi:MAG TPA: glycosyltransferase family 4 protein [Caulobacteraceae bacterium]|jgi:glycosyltransferase involved in cell wall biosynthesis